MLLGSFRRIFSLGLLKLCTSRLKMILFKTVLTSEDIYKAVYVPFSNFAGCPIREGGGGGGGKKLQTPGEGWFFLIILKIHFQNRFFEMKNS